MNLSQKPNFTTVTFEMIFEACEAEALLWFGEKLSPARQHLLGL